MEKKLNKSKYNPESLVYPDDIGTKGNGHFIVFNINMVKGSKFKKEKTQKIENSNDIPALYRGSGSSIRKASSSGGYERIDKMITMYMPENITETLAHNWDNTEIGSLSRVIETGGSAADGDTDGALQNVKDAMADLALGAVQFASPLNAKTLANIGKSQLANPMMEMSFNGTTNRTWQFEFKFMPKNAVETQNIKDIIRSFKFHSAPELKGGQKNYLLYPSTFDISFMFKDGSDLNDHPFLPKVSTCALTSFTPNYGGSNGFSSLKDGTPTEVTLQLEFTELEFLTKNRIEEGY